MSGTSWIGRPHAPVGAVALAPDGSLLAAAAGEAIWLLDAATGALRASLGGDSAAGEAIARLAFSPGGGVLVAAGASGALRAFDVAGAREVGRAGADGGPVQALAVSADGLVAVAAADATRAIRLVDLTRDPGAGGAADRRLAGPSPADVRALAFADASLLAVSRDGALARLPLDGAPAGPPATLLPGDVALAAFSRDGRLVVLGRGVAARNLCVFEVATGREVRAIAGHGRAEYFEDDPDDDEWPPSRRSMGTHERHIRAVALSGDGALVASAGDDDRLRVFEVATGREVGPEVRWREEREGALGFAADGTALAARVSDLGLLRGGRAVALAPPPSNAHAGDVRAVAFSPDGALVATAITRTADVRLSSATTGAFARRLDGSGARGHDADLLRRRGDLRTTSSYDHVELNDRGLAWSPDGALVFAADAGGLVVREAATGRLVRTIAEAGGFVARVAVSEDGRLVATSDPEGVRVFEVATGAAVARLDERGALALAFAPGGRLAAGLGLWDVAAGRRVGAIEAAPPIYSACAPGGARVALAGRPDGGAVEVFEHAAAAGAPGRGTALARLVRRIAVPEQLWTHPALSRDGRRLATSHGHPGACTLVFSVDDGRQLARFELSSAGALAFSPDGRRLAVAVRESIALVSLPASHG